MKLQSNIISLFALLLFLLTAFNASAQTTTTPLPVNPAAVPEFPQWAKDLRRWEIVAFGSFPFTILTATMAVDSKRWYDANKMDFSEDGRRYAPWPLKSAGAVDMTKNQQMQTILIAAGLSAAIAFTDFTIIQIKRSKERKRILSIPTGTTTITTQPWPAEETPEGAAPNNETEPENQEP